MASPDIDSVSRAGVRDGEPAALAALCTTLGPAALAYASAVCPSPSALRAAAEAFARVRGVLVAVGDVDALRLDRLLLGAVRRTTAELAPPARGAFGPRRGCAQVPTLIAARLEGELSPADGERLEQHLARDAACRDIEGQFLAAERAWADPPATLPPEAAIAIVGALAGAGPLAGEDVQPPEVEPAVAAAEPAEQAEPAADGDAVALEPSGPGAADVPAAPVDDDAAPDPALAPEHVDPVVHVAASRPPAFARARRHRPVHEAQHGVLRTVVLPLSVVAAAAVAAMAIAGVFGEDQPQPLPPEPAATVRAETIPPAGAPTATTPSPDAVTDAPPPAVVRGDGEDEDALGGLGVPGPGTAGALAR